MEKTSVLVALFAALIAVLGLVPAFPLALGVPITAQSLGVMLCGTILGSQETTTALEQRIAKNGCKVGFDKR